MIQNQSLSSQSASVTGVLNELVSLTEAYKVISKLRIKRQVPQKQLVTWKGKLQPCEQPVKNYYKDRTDQLKLVSTRLLMFEFQLLKKQKEIETILLEKEQIITQQQRIIAKLKRKLHDHHIETDTEEADLDDDVINPLEKIDEKFEDDNDSDSAVVMEDSDCVSECPSSSSSRYSNCAAITRSVSDAIDQPNRNRRYEKSGYAVHQQTQFTPVVSTYNRVMSNHRSVTKPKDVKYKRINKAKSKSLEELRDKLKNWLIISND